MDAAAAAAQQHGGKIYLVRSCYGDPVNFKKSEKKNWWWRQTQSFPTRYAAAIESGHLKLRDALAGNPSTPFGYLFRDGEFIQKENLSEWSPAAIEQEFANNASPIAGNDPASMATASTDSDQAPTVDHPKSRYLFDRANTWLAQGNFPAALTDYNQYLKLATGNSHAANSARLLRYLIQRRLGQTEAEAVLTQSALPTKQNWAGEIARFLIGQSSAEKLHAAETKFSNLSPEAFRCEACYYTGMKALLGDEREQARTLFEQCIATHQSANCTYPLAQAELARLPAPDSVRPDSAGPGPNAAEPQ
jgi:hypothetical protein